MTTQTEALKLALEALCTCGPQQKQAITAIKEALAQQSNEQVEPVATSTSNLREMLDIINDTDSSRWEIGFRNIVAILYGPRHTFEIKDVVENVRTLYTHLPVPTAQPEPLRDAVLYLSSLVYALDNAFISSWQSTHHWQTQLDEAKEYLAAHGIKE